MSSALYRLAGTSYRHRRLVLAAPDLPMLLAVIIGLALVLLTFALRAPLVPLESILGYLLSVFPALGAEVAVFQWGWAKHLLGITPGVTLSFLPVIVLTIIFGLSNDYEVFVVSRIKEEYGRTRDARGSIRSGLAYSSRVVTAAALIMALVFVAFIDTNDPTVKAIAFTLAAGVFLDAFLVRLVLVPALLAIGGTVMWHCPAWLRVLDAIVSADGVVRSSTLISLAAQVPYRVLPLVRAAAR